MATDTLENIHLHYKGVLALKRGIQLRLTENRAVTDLQEKLVAVVAELKAAPLYTGSFTDNEKAAI